MPTARVAEHHGSEPVDLYYELHGDLQSTSPIRIIFIGGFGNICHQWDLQVEYFSKLKDYQGSWVHRVSVGSMGLKVSLRLGSWVNGTHEMALDTLDLLNNHLRWEKFHLVGLSMGGMIAQELAYLCRFRLLSLTLESTYAAFNGLPKSAYMGLVLGGPKLTNVDEFASHVVGKLLFPKEWLDQPAPPTSGFQTNRENMIHFTKSRFEITGLQNPVGRANQQVACITHSMSESRLRAIRDAATPTLVITGTNDDVLIQPASSIYLAKMLRGTLEIFEGCGHAIRLQEPERHNKLVQGVVERGEEIERVRRMHLEMVAGAGLSDDGERTARNSISDGGYGGVGVVGWPMALVRRVLGIQELQRSQSQSQQRIQRRYSSGVAVDEDLDGDENGRRGGRVISVHFENEGLEPLQMMLQHQYSDFGLENLEESSGVRSSTSSGNWWASLSLFGRGKSATLIPVVGGGGGASVSGDGDGDGDRDGEDLSASKYCSVVGSPRRGVSGVNLGLSSNGGDSGSDSDDNDLFEDGVDGGDADLGGDGSGDSSKVLRRRSVPPRGV
ncbi:hypothetical protein HDU76_009230, partial [Blyttiomyces sp. JEL0837]